MYNKLTIVGHLTRDIELRYTTSGAAIGSSAIATTRHFTVNGEKREETCFIDVTFFGKQAEIANQYLHKGSKVLLEGRLKFDQWTDNNGQNRSKHSLIVEVMRMLDSKSDNGGGNAGGYQQNGNYQQGGQQQRAQQNGGQQRQTAQQNNGGQRAQQNGAQQRQTAQQNGGQRAQQNGAQQQAAARQQQTHQQQQYQPEDFQYEDDAAYADGDYGDETIPF
ncbi:single-stranded DNA-binding protein [Campylobacter sp. MOP51]|uniref:single-stranded DNA-binding protein n=1 Tax=Campylobacter canis TaxID=3378588 RepID=UPI003C619CF0